MGPGRKTKGIKNPGVKTPINNNNNNNNVEYFRHGKGQLLRIDPISNGTGKRFGA